MRFNIVINQQKCMQYNLNVNQAALMAILNEISSWATERVIKGKTYWHISRNKVIEEIPLFYSKPDTVYRAFKFLADENMIEYIQMQRMDFVRLTAKGKMWNKLGSKSELGNESVQLGNESEFNVSPIVSVNEVVKPTLADLNPTYNIHNNTSNKRDENALDFLASNFASRFEAWCMQHKTKIGDEWAAFCDDYNCKIIEEKKEWEPDVLFARLTRLANNWKKMGIGPKQDFKVHPQIINAPSGQKITFAK